MQCSMPMKIALIEPYVSEVGLKSYVVKTEPSHLVGMYNQLVRQGVETALLDASTEQLSSTELAQWLLEGQFTHAGFTVYDYLPSLAYVRHVLELLQRKVTTILGGPGPTHTPERIARHLIPDWIVRGDGEPAMNELVRTRFQPDRLPVWVLGKVRVIESPPASRETIPYFRPYSLVQYNYEAAPQIQRGCPGKCIFCLGAYEQQIQYLSPERTRVVIQHLVEDKQAQTIAPCGSDFTAIPDQANAILQTLLEKGPAFQIFRPSIRLDTLIAAIRQEPELWQNLAARTRVTFESAIESFAYPRLCRLGKNVPRNFTGQIFQALEEIFTICPATLILDRIALDPTITIDEFILDNRTFLRLLETFPEHVTVRSLMNPFVPLWGTPAMAPGNCDSNPWAHPERIHDPLVAELKERLLEHPQFRTWCRLAEQISHFKERNRVFREILQVVVEQAEALKKAPRRDGNPTPPPLPYRPGIVRDTPDATPLLF